MKNLAVVYFISPQNSQIDIFKKKYDPNYVRIGSHITILYPIRDVSHKDIKTHLSQISSTTKSFNIKLNKVQKTQDGHLLFLVYSGLNNLLTLEKQLRTGILKNYSPDYEPYAPHVTLGYFNNSQLLEQAYLESNILDTNIQYNFDTLYLLEGNESETQIIETYSLQK